MMNQEPRLLSTLQVALLNLFSQGNRDTKPFSSNSIEAHSYLMRFQSRNFRRKIQSLQQSERDSSQSDGMNKSLKEKILGVIGDDYGSIFFTCVAILSRPYLFSQAERLFCAQTLLGRIRRMPTYQAIDLEFEDKYTCTEYHSFTFSDWKNLLTLFTTHLSSYHTSFGPCLSHFIKYMDEGSTISSSADEEKLKGNLSMILIACLIFIQNSNKPISHTVTCSETCYDPITFTLSGAMAIFALRLRCAFVYGNKNMFDDGEYNVVKVVVESLDRTRAYFDIHPSDFAVCVCSSLAMIPDAIFGSSGGARGSLSMNPQYVRTCYRELNDKRQGVEFVKQSFHGLSCLSNSWIGSIELRSKVDYHLLTVCERWAKFFTLPFAFVDMTIPLVERYIDADVRTNKSNLAIGLCYVIRLFESACMDADNIQAMYLGLSSEQQESSDQDCKKRQGSKSKRRLKERTESIKVDEDGMLSQAGQEAFERGEVSCRFSVLLWTILFTSVSSHLDHLNDEDSIDGEGVISCLLMCCSACVPFIIEFAFETQYHDLLQNLLYSTGKVCCSTSRYIRSQSIEIIERIYSALVTRTRMTINDIMPEFEQSIALVLCECCTQLAFKSSYPLDYFNCMTEESDEELENERNDVRDLLRTICDVEGCFPSTLSSLILENILVFCKMSLDHIPVEKSESIVHILSSLAKSINWISSSLLCSRGNSLPFNVVTLTIKIFHKLCGDLLAFLSSPSPCLQAFAVIRLLSLAVASFSPTFNYAGIYLNQCSDYCDTLAQFNEMLGAIVTVTVKSLQKIPELFGDNSQCMITHLNIRGAMRAPGGEDHVSCIALMRLSFESENLATYWLNAGASVQRITTDDFIISLIRVHDDLKLDEMRRGPGIDFGSGVTPKTRRILLNTITRLVFTLHGISESTISRVHFLFQQNYEYALQIYEKSDSTTTEKMFHICEATFDLASFSPDLIYCSLCPTSTHLHSYCCIIQTALSGYSLRSDGMEGKDIKYQWCRLRAAIFTFLQECIKIMLPHIVTESLVALIEAECNAIASHFHDTTEKLPPLLPIDLCSEDTIIPSGAYLRVLADYIHIKNTNINNLSSLEAVLESVSPVLFVLTAVEKPVYSCIGSLHPEFRRYIDPRPTLAESWFQTMLNILILIDKSKISPLKLELLEQIVFRALKLSFHLMFIHEIDELSSDHKHSSLDISVDGPQTYVMMNFLNYCFKIFGMNSFTYIALEFKTAIQLDVSPEMPDNHLGGILICGALFRAFSGSLPPWIIENAPELYFSFYQACGGSMDLFYSIMIIASEVRIKENSSVFSHVRVGDKLGGHLLQTQQIQQLKSTLKVDTDWKQLKSIIKSACGGKKKSSSFANKPTSTIWQFDRI